MSVYCGKNLGGDRKASTRASDCGFGLGPANAFQDVFQSWEVGSDLGVCEAVCYLGVSKG